MNYCLNYKIENGAVVDKHSNQQVLDENTILKIKASILLFKESKDAYQSDVQQFGKTNKSQEDYIKKTMEKFSVNNEENSYGINKLVNAILNANGHYEEMMSGNNLQNSKFSILVAPKNEYGIAYLKLKFREKGLDIEDIKISQDLSELQHNGVSKVIIDFKIKKYEKQIQSQQKNNKYSSIQHPRANELNELEKQKQIAKNNNDEVLYNYAQSAIEKIIRESRIDVAPKKWESMSIQDKIAFVKIKINESKILHDQDEFNYWSANLNSLNAKLVSQSEVKTYNQSSYNSVPVSNEIKKDYQEQTELTIFVNHLREKMNKVKAEYKFMLSDGYIDDVELAVLINRINELIDNANSLKSFANNQNEVVLLNSIEEMLRNEQKKMITMQKGIEKIEETRRTLQKNNKDEINEYNRKIANGEKPEKDLSISTEKFKQKFNVNGSETTLVEEKKLDELIEKLNKSLDSKCTNTNLPIDEQIENIDK